MRRRNLAKGDATCSKQASPRLQPPTAPKGSVMQNAPDHTLVAGPGPRRAGSRPKDAILAEPAQPRLSAARASLDARQPTDAFDPRDDGFTAAAPAARSDASRRIGRRPRDVGRRGLLDRIRSNRQRDRRGDGAGAGVAGAGAAVSDEAPPPHPIRIAATIDNAPRSSGRTESRFKSGSCST